MADYKPKNIDSVAQRAIKEDENAVQAQEIANQPMFSMRAQQQRGEASKEK
ncbi:hypothetical protein [Bacillus taeanensis]|uniref:hypothetical protein n=1 Tax=Bacillus taeanensis TaxID=273032 RepID=UPI0015F02DF9|nr:hypothetical protein [Bacillus taeanensis]